MRGLAHPRRKGMQPSEEAQKNHVSVSPPFVIFNSCKYDLSHLLPQQITFLLADKVTIQAECRFKSHCYTRELDDGESSKGLLQINDDEGNIRFFCPQRYALSLKLHGWISSWCHNLCIMGKNYKHGIENWLVVEDEAGVKVKVAFSIEKHLSIPVGLMLWIRTTHPYDRSTPDVATRANSFPFNTIAKTVAHTGKQPKPKVKR